jgi:hypothetical protein
MRESDRSRGIRCHFIITPHREHYHWQRASDMTGILVSDSVEQGLLVWVVLLLVVMPLPRVFWTPLRRLIK